MFSAWPTKKPLTYIGGNLQCEFKYMVTIALVKSMKQLRDLLQAADVRETTTYVCYSILFVKLQLI